MTSQANWQGLFVPAPATNTSSRGPNQLRSALTWTCRPLILLRAPRLLPRRTPEPSFLDTPAAPWAWLDGSEPRVLTQAPLLGQAEDELTAAHPDYPPGTLLKVTNISTGKSVVVQVNGHIARDSGWVISVSQRAAEALDFMRSGSAEVRVEPVDKR